MITDVKLIFVHFVSATHTEDLIAALDKAFAVI